MFIRNSYVIFYKNIYVKDEWGHQPQGGPTQWKGRTSCASSGHACQRQAAKEANTSSSWTWSAASNTWILCLRNLRGWIIGAKVEPCRVCTLRLLACSFTVGALSVRLAEATAGLAANQQQIARGNSAASMMSTNTMDNCIGFLQTCIYIHTIRSSVMTDDVDQWKGRTARGWSSIHEHSDGQKDAFLLKSPCVWLFSIRNTGSIVLLIKFIIITQCSLIVSTSCM
jgi:hypothetical protein